MDAYKDMDVKVENVGMQYPSTLVPGTTLPDAKFTMSASSQGFQVFNMLSMLRTEKLLEASITVPAGTFSGYKDNLYSYQQVAL